MTAPPPGVATAVSVTVEVGLGGTLLVAGRPLEGAHGAAGEFGHLPFGDPAVPCPCGAWGCWGPEVDGTALARHLGAPSPENPRAYAETVLDRAAAGEPAAAAAVERVGGALGRGVAGLVNAHDPDVVVLGGLAGRLRGPAFDTAFSRGLMAHRRTAPPPVRDAVHGDAAALRGAIALALDHVTSPEALARSPAPRPVTATRTRGWGVSRRRPGGRARGTAGARRDASTPGPRSRHARATTSWSSSVTRLPITRSATVMRARERIPTGPAAGSSRGRVRSPARRRAMENACP